MPVDKVRKHAIRDRMAAAGERYTAAARAIDAPYEPGLLSISEVMQERGLTYAEAAAFLEDPARRTMCEDCGWTFGMVCPECAEGCGCSRGCTGWRHREFAGDDDDFAGDDPYDGLWCEECGASTRYECSCA